MWTCHWNLSGGVITPSDMMPLEAMSESQMMAELSDLHARGRGLKMEKVDADTDKHLRMQRGGYPEYLAPWDMPDMELIVVPRYRGYWQPSNYKANLLPRIDT